jgi:FdhD protein
MKTINITKIEKGKREDAQDLVAEEVFLKIFVNEKKLTEFSCAGININELVIGYLYFHGFINIVGDITELNYDVEKETVHVQLNKPASEFMDGFMSPTKKYSTGNVLSLMKEFTAKSEKFLKTGAVHSSAIAAENQIIKSFDDLSRHNTIFMLLGYSLMNNIILSDKILLLTCRLTKSIMELILKANFRVVVTKAAPTFMSVDLCEKNNIALAGFARGDRMNIYNLSETFL